MTATKQLVYYLRQLPDTTLLEPLLDSLKYLLEQLSLPETAPALLCWLAPDGQFIQVQLHDVVIWEHRFLDDGNQQLGIITSTNNAAQWSSNMVFKPAHHTVQDQTLGLAYLPVNAAIAPHWHQATLTALQLVAQLTSKNRNKRPRHNPAIYEAVMNPSARQALLKAVQQADQYTSILEKAVQELLQQPDIQAVQDMEVFRLEKGQAALRAFEAYPLPDATAYEAFQTAYNNYQGRYDDFVTHLVNRPVWQEFALRLGTLVAYCHARAANKQTWNTYPDKRTVYDTGVVQSLWVNRLIAYQRAGNQLDAVETIVARHALRYLQTPEQQIPLLSQRYRHRIATNLLHLSPHTQHWDAQVRRYLARFTALSVQHPANYTYLLERLLMLPDVQNLWNYSDEDIYQSELLSASLEEPTPHYLPMQRSIVPLNQILYGPPGCGKTYFSIRRALALLEHRPLPDILALDTHRLQERLTYYKEQGQLLFTSFHQAMSYEDFIEGIKPTVVGNTVQYTVQDGLLKQLAARALEAPNLEFVLVIDEINRGNVVQIFGELLTLLEGDKRLHAPNALEVQLPYSKTTFGLPPNLYLIGTMNSADRSAEQLDFALRRRFSFVEMLPEPSLLPTDIEGINLAALLRSINERITLLLDAQHSIGHAYFMPITSFKELQQVFNSQVIPLLVAYFYGDLGKVGLILGRDFVQKTDAHYDSFASFDDEELDRFSDRSTYKITTLDLPKEAYRHIYT